MKSTFNQVETERAAFDSKEPGSSQIPEENLIRSASLDLLFKNLPLALAVNLVNSLLSVFLFWEVVFRPGLIAWFSGLLLVTLYRASLIRQFRKSPSPETDPGYWEGRYTVGAGLAGMAWGSVVLLLFRGESIVYQVFASFVLGGMVVGSVAINSVLPKAFMVFTVPAVLPMMTRFFLQGETVYTLMGVITLIFGAAMFGAGFQFRSIINRSIRLGIENREVVRRLFLESERTNRYKDDLQVFRTLIDRTNDAIFIIEPETGRFVDVNQKAIVRLGYLREELLRMSVFDVSTGLKDKEAWKAHLRDLKGSGFMTLEGTQRRKDGSTFPVETSANYIPIGAREFVVAVVRDITERRKSESALKRANRQNELILRNSEEGIFGMDLEGNTTFINPAGARMIGWDTADLIRKPYHSIIHHTRADGGSFPVSDCPIHATLEKGAVHQVQNDVFWRKDGTYFPVEYTSSPIMEENRVRGAVVVFRDATQRKALEKARFRKILEAAPDAVVGVDRWGTIRLVNTQTERLFGYSRRELLGRSVEMLLPERFKGIHSGHRKAYFDAPETRRMVGRELVGRRKNGSEFPVDVSLSMVNTDEGDLSLSMIRDVTERKKMDAAIKNTASELQLTFDSIDVFVLVTDLEGRVLRVNNRVRENCGIEVNQRIGKECSPKGNGMPCEALADIAGKVRETGLPQSLNGWNSPGGRVWDIYGNLTAKGDSGREPRVILVAKEVTEMVRLQEMVHRNRRLTELGELVSGVSHEVRNPLFSISATLDAFQARFGKKADFGPYLKVFRRATQRLLDLMQDLLDFGRPITMEFISAPLSGVIEKAVRDCEAVSGAKNIKVLRLGMQPDFLVDMDSSRLVQVFRNLVENAVQHSPKGGSVVMDFRKARRDPGNWIECRVMDSGEGFKPGEFSRVFEPFYSHRKGGTGLGLSIVRRLVEEHGGRVEAGNQSHGGGVVTVTLPLSPSADAREKKGG